MTKMPKSAKKCDQEIGLNGSVQNRIVDVFIPLPALLSNMGLGTHQIPRVDQRPFRVGLTRPTPNVLSFLLSKECARRVGKATPA